jgi:hypothetical protein
MDMPFERNQTQQHYTDMEWLELADLQFLYFVSSKSNVALLLLLSKVCIIVFNILQ